MKFQSRYSDEDGGFVATVDEFPSLCAFGETDAEARREIKAVVGFVLEDLNAENQEQPQEQKS